MKRMVVVMLVGLVSSFGTARLACAQSTTVAAPNVELSGGYQYQHFDGGSSFAKGWYADIAKSLGNTVSLVGQVTGSYKSETMSVLGSSTSVSASAHSFMGGLRFSTREAKATFFVQGLVGAVRLSAGVKVPGGSSAVSASESDTAKAGLVGVGLTVAVSRNVSLRVGGDYVEVFPNGSSGYITRATAGLVYAFGSK